MKRELDLLLVTASNYPLRPIYPYAFVQVSALARARGVTTRRLDLLKFPRERWPDILARAIGETRARGIGLHVRQTDSLIAVDYRNDKVDFHPLRQTRAVVGAIRELTRAPIIVGGFGFTLRPEKTLSALEADAGVAGEPDDFFAHYDAFVDGRLSASVPNVVLPGASGPRTYHGPNNDAEYTDPIIDELIAFYGPAWMRGPHVPTVAVEVARGCPYACYFCTEPAVKGRKLRVRSLDAAFADVERLVRRGFHKIWFVCSEANIGGPGLVLELAARMRKVREAHGEHVVWTCYVLPTLKPADLREVVASGWFMGGFNDLVSLEPAEMRRARVPYGKHHAISFLQAIAEISRTVPAPTDDVARDRRRHLGLFLAHPEQTVEGIATTLAALDDAGLLPSATRASAFEHAFLVNELRTWKEPLGAGLLPDPEFVRAPALDRACGPDAERVATWLTTTVLSTVRRRTRDEEGFVRRRRRRLEAAVGSFASYAELLAAVHRRLAPFWAELGIATTDGGVPAGSDFAVSSALLRRTWRELAARISPPLFAVLAFEYGLFFSPGVRFLVKEQP